VTGPLGAFLEIYAEPEFQEREVYLARWKDTYRFTEELLTNGDFSKGTDGWSADPGVVYVRAPGTVTVTARTPLVQAVAVGGRSVYRYAVRARCDAPGLLRVQVNWHDASH
jgi:hypothetical protein